MALVIGLTGGIGSGKSAVSDAFGALGVEVTDTDRLAHSLTAPGQAGHDAVVGVFGRDILRRDGTLDRAALRAKVFADDASRARLESVLHPLIRAAAARDVAHWRGPYGILVVPLLLERGGLAGVVQRVLVVDCSEDQQVRRVIARTGMSESEVRAIMATQTTRADRLARADDVIDNNGPLEAVAPRVRELDQRYRMLAAAMTA